MGACLPLRVKDILFFEQRMSSVKTFSIPIRSAAGAGDSAIVLRADELPNDVQVLIGVLKNEQAPLSLWLPLAVEYYKRGQVTLGVARSNFVSSFVLVKISSLSLTLCDLKKFLSRRAGVRSVFVVRLLTIFAKNTH